MSLTPQPGILDIAPYQAGLSKAKGAARVIKLSSNENPFGSSEKARAAYRDAALSLQRYPESSAAELREAIAQAHGLPAEQIVCGAGSDELLSLLCKAYAGVGSEVIYTEHGFLMYPIAAMAVGATPVKVPEKHLRTDVDAILAAVTARTRIVFLANPNNPTGSYLPFSELERLRAGLPNSVLLVLDAAYAEYVEAPDYHAGERLVAAGDNTVMTRTFSKIYGLAALRLGWVYAPLEVVQVLHRVRGPFNVSAPAIKAGVAALADSAFVVQSREHNTRELARVTDALTALGLVVYPSVANFLLIDFAYSTEKAAGALAFLMERGIVIRAMDAYGLPSCLRATIGSREENDAVIAALGDYWK